MHFTTTYKTSEYNSDFPPILLLCAKYHVLWIVKWHYQIEENILIRSFVVKWFDKFDRDRIINFVYEEFPLVKQKRIEDKPSFSTPSLKECLKGKSPEELLEIAQMAAIQCPDSQQVASILLHLPKDHPLLNPSLLFHFPRNGIRMLKTHMKTMI